MKITMFYRRIYRVSLDGIVSSWCVYKCEQFPYLYYMDDRRKDKTFMIRDKNDNSVLSDLPSIPNFSNMKEEELFQASLVWDYPIPLELVKAVQERINLTFYTRQEDYAGEVQIDY